MSKCRWILCATAIIIMAVAILYSICPSANANVVTMIAGLLSAAATAILGGIAIWQNERYKSMSDKYNTQILDLTTKPLIYLLSINDPLKEDRASFTANIGVTDPATSLSMKLLVLEKIVVNLTISSLIWTDENGNAIAELHQSDFKSPFDADKLFSPNQTLIINISNNSSSTKKSHVTFILEYENVYRFRYRQTFSFSLYHDVNSLVPDNENIVSQPAERIGGPELK